MESSRVVVEPVETIDIHQVIGATSTLSSKGEDEETGPTHVAHGCLRIALQPTATDSVDDADGSDKMALQEEENKTASPQTFNPPRFGSKDDALSVVIEKLTEIVHSNKQMDGSSSSRARSPVSPEKHKESICGASEKSDSIQSLKSVDMQKLYKCPDCPCLFALTPQHLAQQKVPQCQCCENRAKKRSQTPDELYLMPEPELKEYKCNLCEFTTQEQSMFYSHLRTHPDDVYKCALCDYATTMKNLMSRHQRSHQISRKYKCNQCEFVTMELTVLQSHMKTHNQTQELILKCSECGYSCKCEENLREHMWQHIDKIAPQGVMQLQKESNAYLVKVPPEEHPSSAKVEISSSTPQPVTVRQLQPAPSLFKCLLCGYMCEKLCTLKAHTWRHAGEKGCSYPVIEELISAINNPQKTSLQTAPVNPNVVTCCGQKGGCCQPSSSSQQCQCDPVIINSKQFPMIEKLVSTAYSRKYLPTEGGQGQVKEPSKPETVSKPETASQAETDGESKQLKDKKTCGDKDKQAEAVTRDIATETKTKEDIVSNVPKKETNIGSTNTIVDPSNDETSDDQINKNQQSTKSSSPSQQKSKGSNIVVETTTSLQKLIADTVERQIMKGKGTSNASKSTSVDDSQEPDRKEVPAFLVTKTKEGNEPDRSKSQTVTKANDNSAGTSLGGLEQKEPQLSSASGVSCSNLLASLLHKSQLEGAKQIPQTTSDVTARKGPPADALESLIAATLAGLKSQKTNVGVINPSSNSSDRKRIKRSDQEKEEMGEAPMPFVPPIAAKDLKQPETTNCPNFNPNAPEDCSCVSENVIVDGQHDDMLVVDDPTFELAKTRKRRTASQREGMVTRSKRRKGRATSPACSEDSNDSAKQGGISSSLLTVIERMRDNPDFSREEIMEKLQHGNTSEDSGESDTDREEETLTLDVDSMIASVNDPKRPYQCKLCHYYSTNKGYVKQHMRMHKEKVPYKCPLCDFIGESSKDLQEHMMDHCKQRVYQCKECMATYYYKSQLRAHVRGHNERVPFQCEICDYETCNSTTFKAHMKTHQENKVYTCSACGLTFNQRYLLRQHKQMCEMNQMYSCQECAFTVSSKEALEKHLQEHTKPFKCEICDYKSASMSGIKNHMKFHATDKPYKCQFCDYAGPYPQSLRAHMRKHGGATPNTVQQMEQYKCNLCGYVCSHLPSLKSHMWKHASEPNYNYDATNDVINAALDLETKQVDKQEEGNPAKVATSDPSSKVAAETSDKDPQTEPRVHKKQSKNKGFEYSLVAFRCCKCGFESIDKSLLTAHLKTHEGQTDVIETITHRSAIPGLLQSSLLSQQQPEKTFVAMQPEPQQEQSGSETVNALNTLETLADGVHVAKCLEPDALQVSHQEEVFTEN